MPDELRDHFLESVGGIKGVYAISDEIKEWLEKSYTPIRYEAQGYYFPTIPF
jgi:hypothetical protein